MASVQGIDIGVSSYITLRPYVGPNYAWLIFQLGYRTIADLTNITFRDLASTAGLGPVRMKALERALLERGLTFKSPTDYWTQNDLFEKIEAEFAGYMAKPQRKLVREDSLCPGRAEGSSSCDADSHRARTPHLRLVPAH